MKKITALALILCLLMSVLIVPVTLADTATPITSAHASLTNPAQSNQPVTSLKYSLYDTSSNGQTDISEHITISYVYYFGLLKEAVDVSAWFDRDPDIIEKTKVDLGDGKVDGTVYYYALTADELENEMYFIPLPGEFKYIKTQLVCRPKDGLSFDKNIKVTGVDSFSVSGNNLVLTVNLGDERNTIGNIAVSATPNSDMTINLTVSSALEGVKYVYAFGAELDVSGAPIGSLRTPGSVYAFDGNSATAKITAGKWGINVYAIYEYAYTNAANPIYAYAHLSVMPESLTFELPTITQHTKNATVTIKDKLLGTVSSTARAISFFRDSELKNMVSEPNEGDTVYVAFSFPNDDKLPVPAEFDPADYKVVCNGSEYAVEKMYLDTSLVVAFKYTLPHDSVVDNKYSVEITDPSGNFTFSTDGKTFAPYEDVSVIAYSKDHSKMIYKVFATDSNYPVKVGGVVCGNEFYFTMPEYTAKLTVRTREADKIVFKDKDGNVLIEPEYLYYGYVIPSYNGITSWFWDDVEYLAGDEFNMSATSKEGPVVFELVAGTTKCSDSKHNNLAWKTRLGGWDGIQEEHYRECPDCDFTESHIFSLGNSNIVPIDEAHHEKICLTCGITKTEECKMTTSYHFVDAECHEAHTHCAYCSNGETHNEKHDSTELFRVEPYGGEDGFICYECSKCGRYNVTIPAAECNHAETEIRGHIEATCCSEGYTGDEFCTKCGELVKKGQTTPINPDAHKYGKWSKVTDESDEHYGMYAKTCELCGKVEYRTVLIGDVNGDGQVNSLDRIILARYLAGWGGYENIDLLAADVNGDGEVNSLDRIILARYLAGWKGYETLG